MFLKRSCIGYRLDRGVEGIGKDGGKFSDDAVRIDVGGWACAMYTCTTHDWFGFDIIIFTAIQFRPSRSFRFFCYCSSLVCFCISVRAKYKIQISHCVLRQDQNPHHILFKKTLLLEHMSLTASFTPSVDHDPSFALIRHGELPLRNFTSCMWYYAVVLDSVLCTHFSTSIVCTCHMFLLFRPTSGSLYSHSNARCRILCSVVFVRMVDRRNMA